MNPRVKIKNDEANSSFYYLADIHYGLGGKRKREIHLSAKSISRKVGEITGYKGTAGV